jgi:hypothetical protein
VARCRPAAAPAAVDVRRGLTVLSRGGEARRQVGPRGATGSPEPGRPCGHALCGSHPRRPDQGIVAAHRAHRAPVDAWSGGDPPARVHPRDPVAGVDLAESPSHVVRHGGHRLLGRIRKPLGRFFPNPRVPRRWP